MSESPILRRYLQTVVPSLDRQMNELDVFFFGAGGSGKSFLEMYPELSPKGFLDNSPSLWGTKIAGVPVYSPSHLLNQDPSQAVVFITSDYRAEITQELLSMGFNGKCHQLAGRPPGLTFDNELALFFRSFEELYAALSQASHATDRIVVLRDFENFPYSAPGDVDVLTSKSGFARLSRLAAGRRYFAGAFRLDVILEGEYLRPYFPVQIATLVRSTAEPLRDVYVAGTVGFAASFAYHIVLHKSPLFSGIDTDDSMFNRPTKYTANIERVLGILGLDPVQLNQVNLIQALQRGGWTPTSSELARIAVAQDRSFQGNAALNMWANGRLA